MTDSDIPLIKQLDRICDDFEQDWEAECSADISRYLDRIDEAHREKLLEMLIELDVELRQGSGQTVLPDDYVTHGEAACKIVQQILDDAPNHRGTVIGNKHGESITAPPTDSNAHTAKTIGPYKLIRLLGEGGMGSVWMAEQEKPVRRRVALKLIRPDIGSKEVVARFEAERQALAMMNHPNIAKILDAGTTDQGAPFFVMELVSGMPLTEYCDQNKLSLEKRLQLFIEVCSGIQHAHQKGIIHRDLKPGNILVSVQDNKAIPKVIDFGLAKATESTSRLTDQSLFTGIGQILGTLKYMSPEQAAMDSLDIDTRTDIYALGVVLYEILTGTTPLDSSSIKGKAVLKVLEVIRELDPVRPSSKLGSSTDEQISTIVGNRRIERVKLNKALAGDLDWIVMKALEKDRTRRYESASGFANDIERYLNSEPVVARPPSVTYKVKKLIKKHRMTFVALSVILFLLVAGIAGTSYGLVSALTAKGIAEGKEKEANDARKIAVASANRANEVLNIVTRSFKSTQPDEGGTVTMSAMDVLKNALAFLDNSELDQTGKAQLLETISEAMRQLGEYRGALDAAEDAAKLVERWRDTDPESWLAIGNVLGLAYGAADQRNEAVNVLEDVYEVAKERLGVDHEKTLHVAHNLASAYSSIEAYDQALSMHESIIKRKKRKYGSDHNETLTSMVNQAMLFQELARLNDAARIFAEVLPAYQSQFGNDSLETATVAHNFAFVLRDLGNFSRSTEMYELAKSVYLRIYGANHPLTLRLRRDESIVFFELGETEKALSQIREVDELFANGQTAGGVHHAITVGVLARFLLEKGDAQQALKFYEKARPMYEANFGPAASETQRFLNNMASCYSQLGQNDAAFEIKQKVYQRLLENLGETHPDTLMAAQNLAFGELNKGETVQAIQRFENALSLARKHLRQTDPVRLTILGNIGPIFAQQGDFEKAIPIMLEAFEGEAAARNEAHPDAVQALQNLVQAELQGKHFDAATEHAKRMIELTSANDAPAHHLHGWGLALLGVIYSDSGQNEKAAKTLAQCLELAKKDQQLNWVKPFFRRSCRATKNDELYEKITGEKLPKD